MTLTAFLQVFEELIDNLVFLQQDVQITESCSKSIAETILRHPRGYTSNDSHVAVHVANARHLENQKPRSEQFMLRLILYTKRVCVCFSLCVYVII